MAKLLQMPLLFEDWSGPSLPAEQTATAALDPELPSLPEPTPVADAAERASALDVRRSWIVEAPAGSGKTGLLIQRYLKLLAQPGVDKPEDVLAITFTRKADGEMRRRVLEQLAAAEKQISLSASAGSFERKTRELAEQALQRDRAIGWRLLDNPHQLNIRTIDSFCAELAGSMPLIAGPGGRYSPTDDPDPLYETAAERTLLHMGGNDPVLTRDLEDLLLYRDAQTSDFKSLLAGMLRQRDQWGELVPLNAARLTDEALDLEVRPKLDRTLAGMLGKELEVVAETLGPHLTAELASLAHRLSSCPGYNGQPSPLALCQQRADVPGTTADHLEHWRCLASLLLTGEGKWRTGFRRNNLGFEASPAQQGEVRDLIAALTLRETERPNLRELLCNVRELPEDSYPDEQWRVVKSLCRVLRQGLLELQVVFGERGVCDFAEVALTARALLRSESACSDLLSTSLGRLKHLLVDEMQDTSAGQYELLETITASWDGATQTVFLVGDPKQSIYEFRQARVERFRRVMQEGQFGQLQVGALRLTANFRSQAALVGSFNEVFEQILPSPGHPSLTPDSTDVPFIAAQPTRSPGVSPAFHWHAAESEPSADLPGADGTETDDEGPVIPQLSHAEQIRNLIEAFLQQWAARQAASGHSLRPPRVAVLARNRAHLAPVIQVFHQDVGDGRLPFRAVDVEALNERPEILDLLALTRAVLHPADRVAWLSVLRSPVCGLTLSDLLTLTGEGPEAEPEATVPHLISTRKNLLSPEGQQLLERVWPTLQRALADRGRSALNIHVERTWLSLGGDAALEGHQLRNARRFLNLLGKLEGGPEPFDLPLLTRRLRTLYAEPIAPDAPVELMTIHKAKGLEWDLVLIPELHRGSGRNSPEFLKWLEFDTADGSPEFILAPIQGKGEEASRLSAWLGRRQRLRETAEAKRLFYVACTRAREEIHLFAKVSRKADGSLAKPKTESLLAAAWPAAESVLRDQVRQPQSTGQVVSFPEPRQEPGPGQKPEQGAGLAIAAAADSGTPPTFAPPQENSPLRRLPLSYRPLDRFDAPAETLLFYPPATTLRHAAPFIRPAGSFGARAFGNALHRCLDLMARCLQGGKSSSELQSELKSWLPRLQTMLRSEGLPSTQVTAEANRAVQALGLTLADTDGCWLLSPHEGARNEGAFPALDGAPGTSLRADRSFFAGPTPGLASEPTHLWIVDYKTAELGGRQRDSFFAEQRAEYQPQMGAYADAAVAGGANPDRLILGLYFPLLPALLYWRHMSQKFGE